MDVTDIQQRLAALGHNPGPVDGRFGPHTAAAIAEALGIKPELAPLADEGDPPWLVQARKALGTHEGPGNANNPTVIDYYAEAAHPEIKQDAVPWCAAFVGAMLKRSGFAPSGSLLARSYLNWGVPLDEPRLGCIVVFKRGTPPNGHVAFYVGGNVKVLGGNQSDAVSIATFNEDSVISYRWPSDYHNPGETV